jgi:hypothetical protein
MMMNPRRSLVFQGLKHCCTQLETKESVSTPSTISIVETPDDDESMPFDDPHRQTDDDDGDDDDEGDEDAEE